MTVLWGFAYGVFGGVVSEIVGLYKFRRFKKLPNWLKSRSYWIITILMILSGGGLVCIYLQSNIGLTPILAVNVGASAPLIISKLADEALPSEPSDRIN
jgi:hypothetical protein